MIEPYPTQDKSWRQQRIALTVLCWGVVPLSTAAAGVSGGRPWCINLRARDGRVDRPMYTTKVESGSAAFSATNKGSVPPFLEWPVRNLTLVATPLCVKGIPNSAAIPEAAVIPTRETNISFYMWLLFRVVSLRWWCINVTLGMRM